MAAEVRIDKWLWAVRLYKTRSIAAEECKRGRVYMSGTQVKPSRMVKVGDVIQLKRPPITFAFKVLALSQNRMNAKLVPEFMQNVTTPDQLELYEVMKMDRANNRARGLGRPTKKERRDLDEFVDETPYFFDEEDELRFDE